MHTKFFKYFTDIISEWKGRRAARAALKSTGDFIRQILDAPPEEARKRIAQFKSHAATRTGHIPKLDAATADMLLEIVYQLELVLDSRAVAARRIEAAAACISTLVENRLSLALERAKDVQHKTTNALPC